MILTSFIKFGYIFEGQQDITRDALVVKLHKLFGLNTLHNNMKSPKNKGNWDASLAILIALENVSGIGANLTSKLKYESSEIKKINTVKSFDNILYLFGINVYVNFSEIFNEEFFSKEKINNIQPLTEHQLYMLTIFLYMCLIGKKIGILSVIKNQAKDTTKFKNDLNEYLILKKSISKFSKLQLSDISSTTRFALPKPSATFSPKSAIIVLSDSTNAFKDAYKNFVTSNPNLSFKSNNDFNTLFRNISKTLPLFFGKNI